MAFDVEAAKAEGYTDEEIRQYLSSKGQPLPEEKPIERGEEQWGTAMSAIPTIAEAGALGYGAKKAIEAWHGGPAPVPPTEAASPASIIKGFVGNPTSMPTAGGVPSSPMAGDAWSQKVVGGMGPGGDSVTEAARNYQLQKGLNPAEAAKYSVNRGGIMIPNQLPPAAPAPAAPPVQQAPNAGNFIERMSNLAKTYGPVAQSAATKVSNAVAPVARVVAPVARVLGSAPVMGAQMATYSSGLNANEDQELARRRAMGLQ